MSRGSGGAPGSLLELSVGGLGCLGPPFLKDLSSETPTLQKRPGRPRKVLRGSLGLPWAPQGPPRPNSGSLRGGLGPQNGAKIDILLYTEKPETILEREPKIGYIGNVFWRASGPPLVAKSGQTSVSSIPSITFARFPPPNRALERSFFYHSGRYF